MRSQQLHSRFSQLVPPKTREMTVTVVGAGMTGSWTALALARMVSRVHVFDFDTVETENVGVQAYTETEIGGNKAFALTRHASGLPLIPWASRFDVTMVPDTDIIVLCVDSIDSRRNIVEQAAEYGAFFIDTRVIGETACIHPFYAEDADDYLQSLPEGDDLIHAPCGAKGTAFAGMWVASQVCAIVNNLGRGMSCPPKTVWHVGMNQSVMGEEAR